MPVSQNLNATEKAKVTAELETSAGNDFKASVVAAELSDNGVPTDTFFFRNQSTFRRAVANDIDQIFWNSGDDDNESDYLIFELNREGIYDMLPEAVVHTQSRKRIDDGEEYKLGLELRRQERDARKFFSPLENEFHYRSLKLDMVERELLKNNNPRRNREFFNYFFEDSGALSDQQLIVLLHILPLSHKIRGDMELIALTVSRIIGYKTRIRQQWNMQTHRLAEGLAPRLSEGTLGTDTVLNDLFTIPARRYDLVIEGLPAASHKDFSGKGRYLNVLNFILPYFFPANADFRIVLSPEKEDAPFRLSDDKAYSYLGFNSYI